MAEPQKPFACSVVECGMTFTNEDHLHVHSKKHDMVLQLGMEQKAAFAADQTPTPTRFIRNCEEVGLFQDLQHVSENPFDEGFKKAMETKQGILCLENAIAGSSSDDVLHTPQMVFPHARDPTLFSASQRTTTISRSSSDESGTMKGATTISSNEITVSRTVSNRVLDRTTTKDNTINKNIDSTEKNANETIFSTETKTVIKDETKMVVTSKDLMLTDTNKLQVPEKQQIMSQKSLDFVVDSLTSEVNENNQLKIKETNIDVHNRSEAKLIYVNNDISKAFNIRETPGKEINIRPIIASKSPPKSNKVKRATKDINIMPKLEPKPAVTLASDNIEVTIKLPNGKRVKMKAVEEEKVEPVAKQMIRNNIINKNKMGIPSNQYNTHFIDVNKLKTVDNPVTSIGRSVSNVVTKLPIQLNITKNITVSNNQVIKNSNIPAIILTQGNPLPVVINNEGHVLVTTDESPKSDTALSNNNTNQSLGTKANMEDPLGIKKTERQNKIYTSPFLAVNKFLAANNTTGNTKKSKERLESRNAASKRYRDRLRNQMADQQAEIKALKEANRQLLADKAQLKQLITEHMKICPKSQHMRRAAKIPAFEST